MLPQASDEAVADEMPVTRDKQRNPDGDNDQPSDEMIACNRKFSRAHAMSIHLNLISVIATVYYGITLASRLNFETPA